MELVLEKDKVTKNNITRYADADNHNLYLKPSEVQELGNPEAIVVTVEAQ